MSQFRTKDEYEKELLNIIEQLTGSLQKWQVWQDLMTMMACSISNQVDKTPKRWNAREKEFEQCRQRLGGIDLPAKFLALVVEALEKNPDQDLLGSLYMRLELGSHWHGQFFTPYNLCNCMADLSIDDKVHQKLKDDGWISICDPACGAGATLVAAANVLHHRGVNYQQNVLFVGQDIDRVVGMMCYIQLSLLGCPGYICIASTISNPICGNALMPVEKEDQEFWYTPFYFRTEWHYRRLIQTFNKMFGIDTKKKPKPVKKEEFTFFFEFEGDEINDREAG